MIRSAVLALALAALAACNSSDPPPWGDYYGRYDGWGQRPTGVYYEEIVVPPGATLFEIAEQYRVALRALIAANGLRPPYQLAAGQILVLPYDTYVVQRGDTLYSIARWYGIDAPSLALYNDIPEPFVIYPGETLILPSPPGEDGLPGARRPPSDYAPPTQTMAYPSLTPPTAYPPPTPPPDVAPEAYPPPPRTSGFIWPASGPVIDHFGPKEAGRRNDGVNIAAVEGELVLAAADGDVVYADDDLSGYGNLVLIRHDGDWVSAYAHNRALLVREGERVVQGQAIAEAGATGAVESAQLHFELRRGGVAVDPMTVLPPRVR